MHATDLNENDFSPRSQRMASRLMQQYAAEDAALLQSHKHRTQQREAAMGDAAQLQMVNAAPTTKGKSRVLSSFRKGMAKITGSKVQARNA